MNKPTLITMLNNTAAQMKYKLALGALLIFCLSACASNRNTVPRHAKYQSISIGVVLDREEVTIGGSNTGIGSYAGSLAAVADSSSNSFISLFLRGIAGGIVGATAEERVTRSQGLQYTIEKNNGSLVSITSKVDNLNVGDCVKITRGGRHVKLELASIGLCNSTSPST